jgi:2-polyprenyl-3-methyl-5-hydroxy-6-metoxy-1,4-benzoquinol methylase
MYEFMRKQQDSHWWFRGRLKCMEAFLRGANALRVRGNVLDIGSGFGSMVPLLQRMGDVDAIEVNPEVFPHLRNRGVKRIYQIENFPDQLPGQKYDVVAMFDVLEHIQDDAKAVRLLHDEVLKANGLAVISVPAYNWLWSVHDVRAHHFRRYGQKELVSLFRKAGFTEIRTTYFMTMLLPLAIVQRFVERSFSGCESSSLLPKVIGELFYKVFASERMLIKGRGLPFGLSIALVGRRA